MKNLIFAAFLAISCNVHASTIEDCSRYHLRNFIERCVRHEADIKYMEWKALCPAPTKDPEDFTAIICYRKALERSGSWAQDQVDRILAAKAESNSKPSRKKALK